MPGLIFKRMMVYAVVFDVCKRLVGWCLAAWRGSRGLAYHSTACYVPGLNFRVRNGTGCLPRAVAAKTNMIMKDVPVLGLVCLFLYCLCTLVLSLDFALECKHGLVWDI